MSMDKGETSRQAGMENASGWRSRESRSKDE